MHKKKYLIIVLFSVLLVACKNEQKSNKTADDDLATLSAQEHKFNAEQLSVCEDRECPKVEVNYLEWPGESEPIQLVNEEIEQELIALFKQSESEAVQPKSLEDAVQGFVEEYLHFKEEYEESQFVYEAQVDQSVLGKTAESMVVQTEYYLYTGGAHGYGGVSFLNVDRKSGKLLTHDDLIKNREAFTDYAEKQFRTQHEIPEEEPINAMGFFFDDDQFSLPENMAVTEEEVILLYNPYEAASYAQGVLRLVFQKKEVAQWLSY